MDHRLHHLRGRDHELVRLARHADHAFLQRRHSRIAHFHREIATRDHDAVGSIEDALQRGNRFRTLDLRDHLRLDAIRRTRDVRQLPRHFHVGGVLRKRYRDKVRTKRHRRLDVLHVLLGQRRRRETSALTVDTLVVREIAAHFHRGVNLFADHTHNVEHDQAVVEQQHVIRPQVARQIRVIEADAFVIAQFTAGVEDERVARDQRDLAVLELAHANLRALQVGHQRDFAAALFGSVANVLRTLAMVVGGAVREVEADHVETCLHHLQQDLRGTRSGADSGDNLCSAMHGTPRLGGIA